MTHDVEWRDPKRRLWLIGMLMPAVIFAAVGLHALTGWSVWLWLGPIVVLGVVPAIDLVTGLDCSNPPDDVLEALANDRYYRWLTFAFLPLQYLGFGLAFRTIARGDLGVVGSVGLAVTVGCIGGIGINTAHELGHKKERHERWLAKIALAQSGYGHFYVEHNRGHHVRVATPADPASSRLGESVYAFWPRTVLGSLRNAWALERRRYARGGRHPVHLGNDVLNAWLMSVALWTGMIAWLGVGVLPYLMVQAVVAVLLLEAVNYLEHYGLLRERVGAPGRERYERVSPRHSWNSNHIATNVLLYHLQRHSDHHAHPTRRYQVLRNQAEAPVLPAGYAGMILLALVPPLWRRVMDPRVVAHYGGDVTRANLSSRYLAAAEARHPAPSVRSDDPARSADRDDARTVPDLDRLACPGCGYVYDQAAGDPREGFPAGTAWSAVPDTWCCPDCGVRDKLDFVAVARP